MPRVKCHLKEIEPGILEGECEFPDGTVTGRKKRAPSKYNLFIGACVKSRTGKIQERFKACAGEYKRQKEAK